eukprot:scaffold29115_cov56-Attheya_sp.AAC.5
MQTPQTHMQIRSFVGSVNFYRHMWLKHAHILAPFTGLQGKKDGQWTEIHTVAFNAMKAFNTRLSYVGTRAACAKFQFDPFVSRLVPKARMG